MTSRLRALALVLPACAACLLAGYGWGRAGEGERQARLERALAEHDARLLDAFATQDGRVRALALRLDDLTSSLSPARPAASPVSRPSEPSPVERDGTAHGAPTPAEDLGALAKAERTIDDAFARKTWSETDRASLSSLLPSLAPDSRERLMKRLIVAANAGELGVTTEGPLF